MKYRISFHVQGFFPTYDVTAGSEKEALNSKAARLNTARADFKDLEFYSMTVSDAFREGTNQDGTGVYTVTYKVDGFYEAEVEADSEEEAKELALELSYEADFGDLINIDWYFVPRENEE